KIHERNRRWTWAYFKERRDDRIKYIDLFKKKKKEEKLSPEEVTELDQLERKLSYEDLRFWRSLARNQLRKENVGVKKAPQKQTWTSWVWGSKKTEEHPGDETQLTEEQRKELYDAIDFDEKKQIADAVDMPKEAIKLQVDMSLQEGSFTLKRDPHGKATEMLQLVFQGFDTKFLQRTDSMLAEVSLETMKLFDGTTEGNLFPQMLNIKNSIPDDKRIEEVKDDDAAAGDEEDEPPLDPFFALTFENNPLDGHADTDLTVKLKAMEFVYNPKFVVEVANFFKPPERHMESIGALMESASATVEGLRQQTRAGLEYALQEHKTIDAKLDLQAPLIIIPDSVTKKESLCMILDAGYISVRSELIDKDTLNEVQSKQKQQYTDEDYKRLEQLMYDKFLVKLQSTQLLLGPSIEETKKQLDENNTSRHLHVVDRINIDFTVETCIVPKAPGLTKFRIGGHLPVLHASISDSKYKSLMKLIDVAIPKFGTDEDSTKKPAQAVQKQAQRPRQKSIVDTDVTGRSRSKSFQFSAQEHELVMEEETDNEDEEFKDAKQTTKEPTKDINQRNFEFKFKVDKLQGSLYRSDPDGKKQDQLLVDLIAENFDLLFYQRPFDMVAEVSLRTLAVEDHVEENPFPEFKNLISSEDQDTNEQQNLFSLKFIKVNPEHPDFMSTYEGIATNLDVSVSTINLLVTRKTLLTLLDFVMITFTNPGEPQANQSQSIESTEAEEIGAQPTGDKIRIKAQLKRIAIILNNDGIRLATLSLTSAEVGIFLMGKTMRVGARLGNLSLLDDVNQGVSEKSSLRQLVSIQGDELADFRYETFDSTSEAYPGYDTSIYLRSGSLKVNFVTEPFRKIMEFGVKFGKMQAIMNAARQAAANQANNIQERASKMHFDIRIKTPIVAFPRMVITDSPERDVLTAYLGELYASNEFLPLDDSEDSDTANKLTAGVHNTRLTSTFNYSNDQVEELDLIDKVDLDFRITSADHKPGYKRPDTEIEGSMSNVNLRITEAQLKFILELSRSIPEAFATDPDDEIEEHVKEELPATTVQDAKSISGDSDNKEEESPQSPTHLGPEIGADDDTWTKLDLVFKVGTIGLELISSKATKPVGDLAASSLSKFSLNETHVKLRMVSDGSLESELLVQSFTITDTRTHEKNKFRKIMSLINTDVKQQFMASVSISGGKERNLIALLTIDSPRIILALDYLFAVQHFINVGLTPDEPLIISDEDVESVGEEDVASMSTSTELAGAQQPETKSAEDGSSMSVSFRVNIVDAQIILIANPAITNSEAIVLGSKQILVSQQHVTAVQVDKLGMFLCRMDKFDTTQLRILDDFSVQTSVDMRSENKQAQLMSIMVEIEPLVLRLSLRDILLAMQIVNKASAMSADDDRELAKEGPSKIDQLKAPSNRPKSGRAPSSAQKPRANTIATKKSHATTAPKASTEPQGSAMLKREEMKVNLQGIRVVLIGDLHELPMLDWSVKNFAVEVRDWSGAMTADTSIETFFNVYNFSKSAWEPLVEPWSLGFHMAKSLNPDKLAVELYSRKSLELTMTSSTIALASKSAQFLSNDEDILSKPRGSDAPYRIRNQTGFDLNVWAQTENNEEGAAEKLSDGEEAPWRFEDPSTTRETLSPEGATGVVGIKLEGSGFDSIERIPVNREGETLYNLKPRKDKVQHRI
ncbi:vacuolar protein sorting-associated protein 13, partial [Aureobasidium melanogenum]